MGKKRNREREAFKNQGTHSRRVAFKDNELFLHRDRNYNCLYYPGYNCLHVDKLDPGEIRNTLAFKCSNVEHQILALREMTQLSLAEFERRYLFTKYLLSCLYRHHNVVYEGILFGSTVNGLGFCDSDVDLRLRRLKQIGPDLYEPISLDEDMVDRTLRNVAYQTTRCSPAEGCYVPSARCPVAKLTFVKHARDLNYNRNSTFMEHGLKYDVSLSSKTPLGSFNSMFLRFLCYLEPKFHLLATVLRYWSNVHQLIVPGYLSSYALINMLIFFCQTIEPPLLPSLDYMRDLYFETNDEMSNGSIDDRHSFGKHKSKKNKKMSTESTPSTYPKALTQIEWQCILRINKKFYKPSSNNEPLSVLLLKFFETFLNFPYSTHIITTRPGRALTHEEFKNSTQFHPRFSIKTFLNIQDPFDLKHNLTLGMQGDHFNLFMTTIATSYERLYHELMFNFSMPRFSKQVIKEFHEREARGYQNTPNQETKKDFRDWGLNSLFVRLQDTNRGTTKNGA